MMSDMETTAVPLLDRVEVIHDRRVPDPADRALDAWRLATALRSLIARDDEPPTLWRSATFAQGVEAIRVSLAAVHTRVALTRTSRVLLDDASPAGSAFPLAAQRLARDPAAVALAIRWLELEAGTQLPSWRDIVRRRTLEPTDRRTAPDAELWFG